MAYRVVISPQARLDVLGVADYILERAGSEVVRGWNEGIMRAIGSLADMPLRCAVAKESKDMAMELHQLMYRSHRIIFRVQEEIRTVDVLRVYHSARMPFSLIDFESLQ